MIADMFDLQRERMRHMLTNAILEMWKKETGSLSSVVIEGTVCISSGNGRTAVIQVSDKFNGVIPEPKDLRSDLMVGRQTVISGSPYNYAPHVDTRPNPSVMAAYLDELSPQSLVSPSTDSHSRPASVAHRNSVSSEVTQMEVSPIHIKEEVLSDESGCDVTEDAAEKRSAGRMCAGTGYYSMGRGPAMADPASPDGSLGELQIVEEQPASSTPKSGDDSTDKQNDSGTGDSISKDPLDLSPKDSDLALSPPQSYTAQVRDVIRQRLLAGRQLAMADNKPEALVGPGQPMLPAASSSPSSFYPVMLQSLGKPTQADKKHMNAFHPYKLSSSGPFPVSAAPGSHLANGHALLTSSLSASYPPPNLKQNSAYSGPLHSMLAMRTQTPSPSPSNPESNNSSSSNNNNNNNDQKTYKCDFCAKTFLFKSKYHEHLPVHTNARPFQCHMCSRTYKYKYDLRVHLRTHMGIPTKSTICPFCTAKYDSNKQLRLHIKEVHGDRPKMPEGELPQLSENTPPQLDRSKRQSLDNMPVFPSAFQIERPKSAELKHSYENMPVFPGLMERPRSAELKTMQPSENLPVFPGNFAVLPPVEGAKVPEFTAAAASPAAPEPKPVPAPDSTAVVEPSSTEVVAATS